MNQNKTTPKKVAILLIVFLSLIAIISVLCIFLRNTHIPQHAVAEIYQNGALIKRISLDTVTEAYTFTVTGENNCHNEVEVRPGSIGITAADCPDKLCVHQGFIQSSMLPITCLPNHLVIQIHGEESLDTITY